MKSCCMSFTILKCNLPLALLKTLALDLVHMVLWRPYITRCCMQQLYFAYFMILSSHLCWGMMNQFLVSTSTTTWSSTRGCWTAPCFTGRTTTLSPEFLLTFTHFTNRFIVLKALKKYPFVYVIGSVVWSITWTTQYMEDHIQRF